jgi:hypothetical protein
MLFLGSFRHDPNRVALNWFVKEVLPRVLERRPEAKLVIVGSDPPPAHAYADFAGALELRGFVEDIRDPLARYAVFICPILSGSGVRVKLLEAFAAGIPVVSTAVGAEGLARRDGELCAISDDPAGFAERILGLFEDPARAAEMAGRARREVEENWDMAAITSKLVAGYAEMVKARRASTWLRQPPEQAARQAEPGERPVSEQRQAEAGKRLLSEQAARRAESGERPVSEQRQVASGEQPASPQEQASSRERPA